MRAGSIRGETFELMARAGYAARGTVFLVIGALALLAAFDAGSRPADANGVLERVLAGPGGPFLLALLAIGLLCFGLWRVAQALADADRLGGHERALARRAAYGASALFYLGLAVWAFMLIGGYAGGKSAPRDWTAWLMRGALGNYLVAAVGIGFAATGIGTAARGLRADLEKRLGLGPNPRRLALVVGRFGFIARGLALLLIGAFLIGAAIHSNPNEATGLGGALRAVQRQPAGGALLAIMALGLLSFGAFQVVQAVYRRIEAPQALKAAR